MVHDDNDTEDAAKQRVKADLTDAEVIRRDLEHWRELLDKPESAVEGRRALVQLIEETEERLAEIEGRVKTG